MLVMPHASAVGSFVCAARGVRTQPTEARTLVVMPLLRFALRQRPLVQRETAAVVLRQALHLHLVLRCLSRRLAVPFVKEQLRFRLVLPLELALDRALVHNQPARATMPQHSGVRGQGRMPRVLSGVTRSDAAMRCNRTATATWP